MTIVQSAAFDARAHLERLKLQGMTVIEDFIAPAQLAEVRRALAPHLGSHSGRNSFEGFATERVYTLVARGRIFEDIVEEPRLLALLDGLLEPGYLLTASQAISIRPGEAAQGLHFDDSFYRLPRPRPAISITMIAAVDAFTAENGATRFLPGSHLWDAETAQRRMATNEPIPVVMPAGAAAVFLGTLIHGGGANRSERPRLAITNQYCEPWARTQENFYLGVPRDRVRAMSPRLQSLLGYDIWPPFMGQVTGSHPLKALEPGFVPPVVRQAAR